MRLKRVLTLLLTGMMMVSAPAAVFASSTEEQIADAQAQRDAAQTALDQEQANMASLTSKKQELESYLEELNGRLSGIENAPSQVEWHNDLDIDEIGNRVNSAESDIHRLKDRTNTFP